MERQIAWAMENMSEAISDSKPEVSENTQPKALLSEKNVATPEEIDQENPVELNLQDDIETGSELSQESVNELNEAAAVA